MMPTIIHKEGQLKGNDARILKIAEKLLSELGDLVVSVESINGWDGPNVRIILKKVSPELIDKVIDAIWAVEEEIGKHGIFIPNIIDLEEFRYTREHSQERSLTELVSWLADKLLSELGDLVISVTSIDRWRGPNVRIVLREISPELVEKVIDAIWAVEEELGEHGIFIPYLVSIDELRNHTKNFRIN